METITTYISNKQAFFDNQLDAKCMASAEQDFKVLVQGNMSINEYSNEYRRLGKKLIAVELMTK